MKKNGFTLIELIATVGLLGMLATITITISVRKINETKEKARDTMIESIELAAKQYVTDKGSEILEFNNYDNAYITLQTLVEKEYFTESLVDPTTKKSLPLTNEVYVTREESGEIKSTYNVNQRKKPKLTLIGSYNEYVEEGKEYVEKGVIAINTNKQDVSENVTTSGIVDTTTPDTYKITYELDNVKITRNVIVYSTNLGTKEYYKFTIDLDGGTTSQQFASIYERGSTITLENPTKDGYTFTGWSVSGTGASMSGTSLTIGTGNIILIANWESVVASFELDDWDTIVYAVKSGNHPYKVGDIKSIDLGSLGTHTIRVSNTTPCNGTLSSQTACGFVLEFVDIIRKMKMRDTATNAGGWPACSIRTYVNNNIYNALPEDLRNGIIKTTVVSGHGSTLGENNFTSQDYLYLLSTREVLGKKEKEDNVMRNDTADGDAITRQLDYYEANGVTTANYAGVKKKYQGSTSLWWLRSPHSNYSNGFFCFDTDGSWFNDGANTDYGVSPAFRLAD